MDQSNSSSTEVKQQHHRNSWGPKKKRLSGLFKNAFAKHKDTDNNDKNAPPSPSLSLSSPPTSSPKIDDSERRDLYDALSDENKERLRSLVIKIAEPKLDWDIVGDPSDETWNDDLISYSFLLSEGHRFDSRDERRLYLQRLPNRFGFLLLEENQNNLARNMSVTDEYWKRWSVQRNHHHHNQQQQQQQHVGEMDEVAEGDEENA